MQFLRNLAILNIGSAILFAVNSPANAESRRPWAEYEPVSAIVIGSTPNQPIFHPVYRAIMESLPTGVLVAEYHPAGLSPLHFDAASWFAGRSAGTFATFGFSEFARDLLPIPVVVEGDSRSRFEWISPRNKKDSKREASAKFANLFGQSLVHVEVEFEGGNLMNNREGFCITVEGGLIARPFPNREFFAKTLGCRRTIVLPYNGRGIGHADERVKFVNDNTVLLDGEEYRSTLEEAGLSVISLPLTKNKHFNYANSLIVNDTVFVPKEPGNSVTDRVTVEIYRRYFSKVVLVETPYADGLGGSIHCLTKGVPRNP